MYLQSNASVPALLQLIPIAALIISSISISFTIYSFKYKDWKENQDKEKKQRIEWFKSLILDYNLEHFYAFFDNVEIELKKLQTGEILDEEKKKINDAVKDHQKVLRLKFIDILIAVDQSLYESTMNEIDDLVDHFTESIFNGGINLNHQPMFEEIVSKRISMTRTQVIKSFFNYYGEAITQKTSSKKADEVSVLLAQTGRQKQLN